LGLAECHGQLLLGRACDGFIRAFTRRAGLAVALATVLAAVTIAVTKTSAIPIAKAKSSILAIPVAIDLSHHGRGA
jgi:hypothetical protein